MEVFEYVKIQKDEAIDLFYIIFTLSLLFSITYMNFVNIYSSFTRTFILFFIFITVVLVSRLLLMKYVAYKNAFQFELHQTFFDQYWFAKRDRVSRLEETAAKKEHRKGTFKGIPSTLIAVFIYILSLGFLIYPSLWNYRFTKIPHLHAGTQQWGEISFRHMFNQEASGYRMAKAMFWGFVYYLVFALLLRAFSESLGDFYNFFTFILFWIAFFTIIPIPGSEGYELYRKNTFMWISALTILILGMSSLLIFQSIKYSIIVGIITIFIGLFVVLWRQLMK